MEFLPKTRLQSTRTCLIKRKLFAIKANTVAKQNTLGRRLVQWFQTELFD